MVTQIVYNQEDRIGLVVEQAKETIPVCSGCGMAHVNAVHSIERVTVEDRPISGKKVFLYVTKRKVVCTEDKRIRIEELDWLRKRYTKRFSDHVFRLTSITTNKEAGWFLGLDDEAVYRIDKGRLEELAEEKLEPVPVPKNMSVDEVAWQKWHKYVTNVVDIDKKKVIWNHEGRGKTVLNKFYKKLGKKGCKEIEAVACDGAKGFIGATREHLANALIVLDHFHVKHYLNDAVDTVRKEELRKARNEENRETAEILHCNQRFLLMQNRNTSRKKVDFPRNSRHTEQPIS